MTEPQAQPQQRPPTKRRKRPSLVCSNCKAKKIKCDKGSPCQPCVKGKLVDSCSYSVDGMYAANQKDIKPYMASAKNPIGITVMKLKQKEPKKSSPPDGAKQQPTMARVDPVAPRPPSQQQQPPAAAYAAHPPAAPHSDTVSVSKSELDFLKQRLKQIEETLHSTNHSSEKSESPLPNQANAQAPPPAPPLQFGAASPPPPFSPVYPYGGSQRNSFALPTQPTSSNVRGSPPPPIHLNGDSNGAAAAAAANGGSGRSRLNSATPLSSITYPSPYDTPSAHSTYSGSSSGNIQLPPLRWQHEQRMQSSGQGQQQPPYPYAPQGPNQPSLQEPAQAQGQAQGVSQPPPPPPPPSQPQAQAQNQPQPQQSYVSSSDSHGYTPSASSSTGMDKSKASSVSSSSVDSSSATHYALNEVESQQKEMFRQKKAERNYTLRELGEFTDFDQLVGRNPFLDTSERINLFENYTSVHAKEPIRRINYGPFAWSSLMKRDNGMRMLWDYMIQKKENEKENNTSFIFAQQSSEISQENAEVLSYDNKAADGDVGIEKAFHKRALESDGYGDVLPYNRILKKKRQEHEQEKLKAKESVSIKAAEAAAAAAAAAKGLKEEENSEDVEIKEVLVTCEDESAATCSVAAAQVFANDRANLKDHTLQLGLTFHKLDKELQLIDKIQRTLPSKKVIWMLVNKYFTWLYPFLPFLDETCFKENIERIIGPTSYEDVKITNLKVEKRLDLAYLGILLVVMRLSYLSLFSNKSSVNKEKFFSNDPSPKAQNYKFLFSNPINIDTVEVAQYCLDQFQIFRKTSLTILQLAVFLRLYHTYAPEDGDGADGGDSQVFGSMLIQMSYGLGLHREPDNFPDVLNNPRTNHLGRKIFHMLCLMDIHQCFTFGNPLCIDRQFYDVKFPFHDDKAANISDIALDKIVTETYQKCGSIYKMVDLLKLLLNARDGCNVSEVCKELDRLEIDMLVLHGTTKECFDTPLPSDTHAQVFNRNFSVKFFLSINAFFMSVYYHFYLYYEGKSVELCAYYLKKMIIISTGEIMPHYFEVLGNREYICDMIINPTLEQFIHKANNINLALIIRVNFVLYDLVQKPDHLARYTGEADYKQFFDSANTLSRLLKRCAEISISAISKISNRYYYAWRITKSHTYLLKSITSVKFYEDNFAKAGGLCNIILNQEQIDLFISIIKKTVDKFDNIEEIAHDFCPFTSPASSQAFARDSNARNTSVSKPDVTNLTDFDQDFINNSEIDSLWIQMISMKYDNKADLQDPSTAFALPQTPITSSFSNNGNGIGNNINTTNNNNGTSNGAAYDGVNGTPRPGGYPGSFSGAGAGIGSATPGGNFGVRHGFDLEEMARFDIFNDLPFDQLFANKSQD